MNLLGQTKIISGLLLNVEKVGAIGNVHLDMAQLVVDWCKTINELATIIGKRAEWNAEDIWYINIVEKDGVVILAAGDEVIKLPVIIFTLSDDPVADLGHLQNWARWVNKIGNKNE